MQHFDGRQLTDMTRIDYFPSKETLVLRMPSALHEAFKSSIVDEIVQQLRSMTYRNRGRDGLTSRCIKEAGLVNVQKWVTSTCEWTGWYTPKWIPSS